MDGLGYRSVPTSATALDRHGIPDTTRRPRTTPLDGTLPLPSGARSGPGPSSIDEVSRRALIAMNARVRPWRINTQHTCSLKELAERINPVVRGEWAYYGHFRRSALYRFLSRHSPVSAPVPR